MALLAQHRALPLCVHYDTETLCISRKHLKLVIVQFFGSVGGAALGDDAPGSE